MYKCIPPTPHSVQSQSFFPAPRWPPAVKCCTFDQRGNRALSVCDAIVVAPLTSQYVMWPSCPCWCGMLCHCWCVVCAYGHCCHCCRCCCRGENVETKRVWRGCSITLMWMTLATSVATAWFESCKLDKPSHIEAEPSCSKSFDFAMAWLWPKMALSGCKRLKCDFVPNLAAVCLSPFILSLDHSIALPCL